MAGADWRKIKNEYIKGGISLRQLAKKHGVSPSQILKRSAAEKWAEKRNQVEVDSESKAIAKITEKNAEIDVSVFDAALKLLKAYADSVEAFSAEGTLPPTMLKDYASALKSIQSVLEKPTDLDIKEQEARIAKLRKDAEKDDNAPNEISITIQGWDESWAE